MILISNCTYPIHQIPKRTRGKQRFIVMLPNEEGVLNWCEECKAMQKRRLDHVRRHNGYTKDCREEHFNLLRKRFGGEQTQTVMARTTVYANNHAPKEYIWCSIGLHYAMSSEMRQRGCRYCQAKTSGELWRQYEENGSMIRNQRKRLYHYTKKLKETRLEVKKLERYMAILHKKKREEEVNAGIY